MKLFQTSTRAGRSRDSASYERAREAERSRDRTPVEELPPFALQDHLGRLRARLTALRTGDDRRDGLERRIEAVEARLAALQRARRRRGSLDDDRPAWTAGAVVAATLVLVSVALTWTPPAGDRGPVTPSGSSVGVPEIGTAGSEPPRPRRTVGPSTNAGPPPARPRDGREPVGQDRAGDVTVFTSPDGATAVGLGVHGPRAGDVGGLVVCTPEGRAVVGLLHPRLRGPSAAGILVSYRAGGGPVVGPFRPAEVSREMTLLDPARSTRLVRDAERAGSLDVRVEDAVTGQALSGSVSFRGAAGALRRAGCSVL